LEPGEGGRIQAEERDLSTPTTSDACPCRRAGVERVAWLPELHLLAPALYV
jgi:hypothetical protein